MLVYENKNLQIFFLTKKSSILYPSPILTKGYNLSYLSSVFLWQATYFLFLSIPFMMLLGYEYSSTKNNIFLTH